jgi:hypothetical protein
VDSSNDGGMGRSQDGGWWRTTTEISGARASGGVSGWAAKARRRQRGRPDTKAGSAVGGRRAESICEK